MNIKKMVCSECGTVKCYLQITTSKGIFHIDKKGNIYDFNFDDTEETIVSTIRDVKSSTGCCERCQEYIPVIITLKDKTEFKSSETKKLSLLQW